MLDGALSITWLVHSRNQSPYARPRDNGNGSLGTGSDDWRLHLPSPDDFAWTVAAFKSRPSLPACRSAVLRMARTGIRDRDGLTVPRCPDCK
ncbi:hypothetical protein BDW74DRAFT_69400 [Aspergillus multicolor]|uniref:uncharacterized protein n=1 Tax=Aspergillus multicolor TaxID=41759 RepID=UPI003CCD4933